MKRYLFFVSVAICSIAALLFLLTPPNVKSPLVLDETLTQNLLEGAGDNIILLEKNGPLDRIITKTSSGNLILTSSFSGAFTQELWSIKGSWSFVFAFFDPLKINILEGDDYRITPVTPGVLSVTSDGNGWTQIVSHSAVLRVELTTWIRRRVTNKKSTIRVIERNVVSSFLLLPSISFDLESKLIPTITSSTDMGGQADILRLYALFRFRFIETTKPDTDAQFLTPALRDDWSHLTQAMTKELITLAWRNEQTWNDIVSQNEKSPLNFWEINTSWLVVNKAKIAKDRTDSFIKNLITLLAQSSNKEWFIPSLKEAYNLVIQDSDSKKNIDTTIRLLSVLKASPSRASITNLTTEDHLSFQALGLSPSRPTDISVALEPFLMSCSRLFLSQMLGNTSSSVDQAPENISLFFDNLNLNKQSFLTSEYFSLVLFIVEYSRYLMGNDNEPDPKYFHIISYLFEIRDSLAQTTYPVEITKRDIVAESMFVFYARLFDAIDTKITQYFFEENRGNNLLQLKSAFLDPMNNANFDASSTIRDAYLHSILCIDGYKETAPNDHACLKSVIDAYRNLYVKISRSSPSDADKYIKLNEVYLKNMEATKALLDYHSYTHPINDGTGILIDSGAQNAGNDIATTEAYLASFAGFESGTLSIVSGSSTDTYKISVKYGPSQFLFEMNPSDGHAISNIIVDNTDTYKDALIRLDDKEKSLRESCQDKKGDNRCDFHQFFLVTFWQDQTHQDPTIIVPTCSRSWINEETRNFVQYQLIEKDFKNINRVLAIGFGNICDLQVIDKEQILTLSNIPLPLKTDHDIGYGATLQWKYIFQRHMFSDLSLTLTQKNNPSQQASFQVKLTQNTFPISDALYLQNFIDFLTKLSAYVETLLSQGPQSSSIILFDTTNKTIMIDDKSFPVHEVIQ